MLGRYKHLIRLGLGVALCSAGCQPSPSAQTTPPTTPSGTSPSTASPTDLVDRLRSTFMIDNSDGESPTPARRPVLQPPGSQSLTPTADGALSAPIRSGSLRVGAHASEGASISVAADGGGLLTVAVALHDAAAVAAQLAEGYVVYPGGYPQADVVERPFDGGLEDYLSFATQPSTREVVYGVTLTSGVAGLRQVGNTLEFLDGKGVPRLRMAPPFAADGHGNTVLAGVSVSGCVVDRNPAPPWMRRPTPPGAASCDVHVTWSDDNLQYPVLLDPTWGSTLSMAVERDHHTLENVPGPGVLAIGGVWSGGPPTTTELFNPLWSVWAVVGDTNVARYRHTSTTLLDGTVLVAGGSFPSSPEPAEASAELYDPVAGTWTVLPSMRFPRAGHASVRLGDGSVLVTGGADDVNGGESASTDIWLPSRNTWIPGPSMLAGRADHTATLLQDGKRVLVAGGELPTPYVPLDSSEIYDSTTNAFEPTWVNPLAGGGDLSSMNAPRAKHAAVLLWDGSVLVMGGQHGGSNIYDDVSEGDDLYIDLPNADGASTFNGWTAGPDCLSDLPPTTGTHCHRFDMATARNPAGAVYFIGGDFGGYDPVGFVTQYPVVATPVGSNTGEVFGEHSTLPVGTIRPRAQLMPDGRVLVAGGRTGMPSPQPTDAAYAIYGIFDTATAGTAELATDLNSYVFDQPIEIMFTMPSPTATDFISLTDGTGAEVNHLPTMAASNGSMYLTLPVGNYSVASYHAVGQPVVQGIGLSVFPLTTATVTTDAASYSSGSPVTVSFSGMTGTMAEMVGISPTSTPGLPVVERYTMGATSGAVTFNGLAPGTYVAEAYVFNLPAVRGSSVTFTVTP